MNIVRNLKINSHKIKLNDQKDKVMLGGGTRGCLHGIALFPLHFCIMEVHLVKNSKLGRVIK